MHQSCKLKSMVRIIRTDRQTKIQTFPSSIFFYVHFQHHKQGLQTRKKKTYLPMWQTDFNHRIYMYFYMPTDGFIGRAIVWHFSFKKCVSDN